jgi:hypothetical protein
VLPAGKVISAHPTATKWNKRCRLQVDGKPAFSATVEWWEGNTSLARVATDAIGVDPGDSKTADQRYIYSKSGAVGLVNCPNPRRVKKNLFVSVRVVDESATAAQMEKLITAYSESVAASDDCEAREGEM